MNRLRDLGVGLSADDFGAGCSSLAIVQELPIDEIKIDRSFVQRMRCDWRPRPSCDSMIDLCARLGIQSVAEGIEDSETLEPVARHGL